AGRADVLLPLPEGRQVAADDGDGGPIDAEAGEPALRDLVARADLAELEEVRVEDAVLRAAARVAEIVDGALDVRGVVTHERLQGVGEAGRVAAVQRGLGPPPAELAVDQPEDLEVAIEREGRAERPGVLGVESPHHQLVVLGLRARDGWTARL